MATGQELIEDALLEIGVGNPGDQIEQEIINHALRILNRMWESWAAEIEPVYASTLTSHTWPASTASQTIAASGADITGARPIQITGIQARVSSVDYTLSQVSFEQYQVTSLKSVESSIPTVYAYQKTYSAGTIYIYPLLSSAATVRIQSKNAMTAFTLAGTIALPEGYELAIQKNLSVALAPAHGRQSLVSQGSPLRTEAHRAKEAIIRINEDDMELWPDPMMPGVNVCDDLDRLTQ